MQADVETFFAEDVVALTRTLAELDARIHPAAEPRKDQYFDQLNEAMCRYQEACRRVESLIGEDRGLLKDVQQRFQDEISPWFDRSWFMHRAKTKPRGYPGDYRLLAAIYDEAPRSRGIGGYLDLYLLNSTLGRAVRARLEAAKCFLVEEIARRRGDVFIINVACGPCREYVDGLEQPDECRIHVTCIDNDRQALEYVRAHVTTAASGISDIKYACYNALRMSSSRANIRKFGGCDVIYSLGLCDYIPDKYLVAMLQGWRDTLNDDGVLYVTFKDAARYDKTDCQWLTDWHFFQRTKDECHELFKQAGLDGDCLEMTRDATGVILNFISRVKRPAAVRVDVPRETRERRRAATAPRRAEAIKGPVK